ncbi:MAG: family 16 glycoside hydrolase [Planctomycetota bacterium]
MIRLLPLVLVLAGGVSAQSEASFPEVPWRGLFDGESLEGWTQVCGDGGFRVEDGAVVGRRGTRYPSSYLATRERWGDFLLEYEFNAADGLNGGVQIRSRTRPHENGVDVIGYQVEIDPSDRAWSAGIYEQGLRGWLAPLDARPEARAAMKREGWNRVRVLARGPRIRTWINDVPAADLLDAEAAEGFLALQAHTSNDREPKAVRWRRMRIKDLGRPSPLDLAPADPSRWVARGEGLVVEREGGRTTLRLDDPARGPGYLATGEEFGDGATRVVFRLRRGPLSLVVAGGAPDALGGRAGFEVVIDRSPGAEGLFRVGGARVALWDRRRASAALRDGENALVVIRCGERVAILLNGERLLETAIPDLSARGRIGFRMPASRRGRLEIAEVSHRPLPRD